MPVTCRCGAEIQDHWKFCYACAGPLPTEEELAARVAPAVDAHSHADPAAGPACPPAAPAPFGTGHAPPAPMPGASTLGRLLFPQLRGEPPAAHSSPHPGVRAPAPAEEHMPLAYVIYAGLLALSVWCLGLAFGMVLPGPDGTDLPSGLRALFLLACLGLFGAPDAAAWPLARLLAGRPPQWDEAMRSFPARFQRLFPLRLLVSAGTLAALMAAGIATL